MTGHLWRYSRLGSLRYACKKRRCAHGKTAIFPCRKIHLGIFLICPLKKSNCPRPRDDPMNKTFTFQILRCAALMMLLAASSKAVDGAPARAGEIAVGDRAPSFTLKDQNDREFSLDAMIKKGPVAVVFIRSIEWCTYCQLQTV